MREQDSYLTISSCTGCLQSVSKQSVEGNRCMSSFESVHTGCHTHCHVSAYQWHWKGDGTCLFFLIFSFFCSKFLCL